MDRLEEILEGCKVRLSAAKEKKSLTELERSAQQAPSPKNFAAAIHVPGRISVIAEMKRQSPSAGLIRPDYNVEEIAGAYERGGAAAISVLTEKDAFGGETDHMARVRRVSQLPIMRKDFIFDVYQVAEARANGADAVLLIADMLESSQLNELSACAHEHHLSALVEVFTEESVSSALKSGSKLIGINTRNLRSLEMRPDNVARISRLLPPDIVLVAESGIKGPADMDRLKSLPVSAVLVGESILKQTDLTAAVERLAVAGKR